MVRRIVIIAVIACCLMAAAASAQVAATRSGGGRSAGGRAPIELGGFYGYSWTWSQEAYLGLQSGTIDVEDSGFWGVHLDYPVRPGTWLELLYSNQSSDLTFKSRAGGKETLTKFGVEYFQIGAVQALKPGQKVVPFTSLSLGWTTAKAKDIGESNSKFSMIIGVGAKIYASERVGLRLQARLPVTFTSGGLGFGVGTGGASAGFYGTGVTQTDVSGGAFLRF